MAKDPAFLFYPGDWLGGTMLLNRHQKGCYIDLLMAQFNSGPLSLDQIKAVLGQDQALWTVLQTKFKTDNCGRFFNEKMATEIEKRKKFVASRSNGKSGRKKSHDLSYDNHTGNHTEDENRNENKSVNKSVNKNKNGCDNFLIHIDLELPSIPLEAVERNQFTYTKNSNTEYVKSQWKVFLGERMNDPSERRQQYRKIEHLTSYFINWMRTKFPENAGSKNETKRNSKTAGANELADRLAAKLAARGSSITEG